MDPLQTMDPDTCQAKVLELVNGVQAIARAVCSRGVPEGGEAAAVLAWTVAEVGLGVTCAGQALALGNLARL